MAQLNVKLSEEQLHALRSYAAERRTPVARLIKDYVRYLLAGGHPVVELAPDVPLSSELAALAAALLARRRRTSACLRPLTWSSGAPD